MARRITIHFTEAEDCHTTFDAYPFELWLVRGTGATIAYEATREVWEQHLKSVVGVRQLSSVAAKITAALAIDTARPLK